MKMGVVIDIPEIGICLDTLQDITWPSHGLSGCPTPVWPIEHVVFARPSIVDGQQLLGVKHFVGETLV
jgi:hypothetical protein